MKYNPTLHKLSNGITVILDPMDLETTNMKIRINGGASIEQPHEYGISHFIEHMLFTGTEKYPSAKIVRVTMRDTGGTRGGSTYPYKTEYYGRILAENLPVLIDVLSEMILHPLMREENIVKEREVINQEIKRSQDDQGRQFNGLVKSNIFPNSYLKRYDTMGSPETLGGFTREILLQYMADKYNANNIIIGLSGKIEDPDKILADLENRFGKIPSGKVYEFDSGTVNPTVIYDVRDDKKQTKLFIGFENGWPDERKYFYEDICSSVFESALSLRLFEEIRDNLGLVYSYGGSGYGDRFIGCNGVMTALSPENLEKVIASTASGCYDIMHRNPVTADELRRKNTMIKLGRADFSESASSRCDRLINFYANHGEIYNPSEFDTLREKMTIKDVMKYSADYFANPISMIAQGPACDIDMLKIWNDNFK